MARQYSPTLFFRRVPNGLLARYFQERHGVLGEIDFEKLNETDVDPIVEAFRALPDSKQAEIEAQRQDIDNIARQGGIAALADEADFNSKEGRGRNCKMDVFRRRDQEYFFAYPMD